jgi:hypothetical protein
MDERNAQHDIVRHALPTTTMMSSAGPQEPPVDRCVFHAIPDTVPL